MRRARHLSVSLLAVLALVFSACGDDDDGSAASDTFDQSEAEQRAEDAIEGAIGGECSFLAEFAGAFEGFDPTAAMGSGGESIDFGTFYGELANEFQEVADAAPGEIEDSFQTMASAMSEVAEQLEGIELDLSDPENIDPETLAALESVGESLDEDFDTAAEEVDTWVQENCGGLADELDLDGTGGGAGG